MRRIVSNLWAGVWLVIGTLLLSGCGVKPTPPTPPVPMVICVEAESRELADFDEFVGRTEPSATVQVQSRVSGFLETIEFDDGELVAEGDLLATIEPAEYEAIHKQSLANIELWKSKLNLAESQRDRLKDLLEKNTVSQSDFDEAEAAVQEANSQIAASNAAAARSALDLKYTKILAPISGRADRALVDRGNLVTGGLGAGTLITRIVTDTPMYAYVDVDEKAVLAYRRQVQAEREDSTETALKDLKIPCYLQLQDEDDFPHEGYLDFAENRIDALTGTIRLRGVFANEDNLLQGGLFVRVKVPKGEPYEGVLIPEQCIGFDQADRLAYVVKKDGTVEARLLELGSRFGEMRAIRSGVRAGEKVVYQGIQKVRDGGKVQYEMLPEPSPAMPSAEGEEPAAELENQDELSL